LSIRPALAQVVKDSIIAPIKARGRTIVSEVQTADQNTGGPTDAVAVQRFSSDRVDTAILVVSAIAKTNFFNQAQAQGFKPRYLENDSGFSTTDTATSTYPKAHFDGTPAFTGLRFGEPNSGLPEPAEAQWCRAAIKKQTGNDIPRQGRDAEYIARTRRAMRSSPCSMASSRPGQDSHATRSSAGWRRSATSRRASTAT
jgi:hypothetical protein